MQIALQLLIFGGFLLNTLAAWFNYKATSGVHQLVNSRMTELLELTRRAARAEGHLEASEAAVKPDILADIEYNGKKDTS
jgi:hypothetical protein